MSQQSLPADNEILSGSIKKISVKLALPNLIGQVFVIIYGLTDTFFISMIDKKSTTLVSAIGVVFPVYFLFLSLSLGLSGGVSSLTARAIGEMRIKKDKRLDKIGDSGIFLAILIGVISAILLAFLGNDLVLFLSGRSLTKETVNNALLYLYHLIPGIIFLLLMHTLGGILQGEGLMKYPAMAMFISVIINIILDPVFIFILNLGIKGAALATSISIIAAFFFLLIVFLKNKSVIRISFHFKNIGRSEMKEIIKVGASYGLNMILISISFMIINFCVGTIGEAELTAWSIVGRMDEFILMIGYALAASTLTIAGQNYGEKNMKRVSEVFRVNIIYGIFGVISLALIYNTFAYPLFSMLTSNKAVLENCIFQVRLISFSFIGIVASIILNSLFLGIGKPLPSLIFSFVRIYIILIPLCLIAVFLFHCKIKEFIFIFVFVNILTFFFSIALGKLFLRKIIV
jgi:putative MATE family efflux protein